MSQYDGNWSKLSCRPLTIDFAGFYACPHLHTELLSESSAFVSALLQSVCQGSFLIAAAGRRHEGSRWRGADRMNDSSKDAAKKDPALESNSMLLTITGACVCLVSRAAAHSAFSPLRRWPRGRRTISVHAYMSIVADASCSARGN